MDGTNSNIRSRTNSPLLGKEVPVPRRCPELMALKTAFTFAAPNCKLHPEPGRRSRRGSIIPPLGGWTTVRQDAGRTMTTSVSPVAARLQSQVKPVTGLNSVSVKVRSSRRIGGVQGGTACTRLTTAPTAQAKPEPLTSRLTGRRRIARWPVRSGPFDNRDDVRAVFKTGPTSNKPLVRLSQLVARRSRNAMTLA